MIRVPLAFGGIAAMGWGVWLLRDDGLDRWQSQLAWFFGGVVAHDGVVAPVVVLGGVVAARLLRPADRSAVAVGFVVWATVSVAVSNVLLPVGGRADNPSLMNRPYVLAWLGLTASVLAFVAWGVRRARRRERRHTAA